MSWKKYYYIRYFNEIVGARVINGRHFEETKPAFYIAYNDNCADVGKKAHDALYRTEAHAIRGAERLYRRVHGQLENAIGLTDE